MLKLLNNERDEDITSADEDAVVRDGGARREAGGVPQGYALLGGKDLPLRKRMRKDSLRATGILSYRCGDGQKDSAFPLRLYGADNGLGVAECEMGLRKA